MLLLCASIYTDAFFEIWYFLFKFIGLRFFFTCIYALLKRQAITLYFIISSCLPFFTETEELRNLATEVSNLLKSIVGVSVYSAEYASVHQAANLRKTERKRKLAQQVSAFIIINTCRCDLPLSILQESYTSTVQVCTCGQTTYDCDVYSSRAININSHLNVERNL